MRDRNPPRGDFNSLRPIRQTLMCGASSNHCLIVDVNPQGGRHWPPVQRTRWTPVFPGKQSPTRAADDVPIDART